MGGDHDPMRLVQGGIFLLLVMMGLDYLKYLMALQEQRCWPKEATLPQVRQIRRITAIIVATFFTVAATLVIRWQSEGTLWQGPVLLILVTLLFGVLEVLSARKAFLQPYLPLMDLALLVIIPPAFAFYLQTDAPHTFLLLAVLGLAPAYLAYALLEQLFQYEWDERLELKTLGTMLGWENIMALHNYLILFAYVLMALTSLLGMPWFILWPVFLTLPIGLLEIWLMERVRNGGKPLWAVMRIATGSVYVIPAYLLAFAFWVR